MLSRYTLPQMKHLWLRPETKFEYWLKVELAFLQACEKIGIVSQEACLAICNNAKINVARIEELDREFEHDLIAFVVSIQETLEAAGVGGYKEEFHKGLTSYDAEDPALILILREAVVELINVLYTLQLQLMERANEHKFTMMIARTHGQFAEPDTFGRLLLVFAQSISRSVKRLEVILDSDLKEGKISGAVGNYGSLDPELEKLALGLLGLRPAAAETQIVQRDRHATLLNAIAVAGCSIEQMCRTFWEMMRSEVGELEEPRKKRQRGSSAMAHKKNPILTERLIGMSRLLRSFAGAGMENIATPECRDISQSSVERHILADATSILHYMAARAVSLVKDLVVFPERMLWNLNEESCGVWASQKVRLALMDAGIDYDTAYNYVQRLSFQTKKTSIHLRELLKLPLSETNDLSAETILDEKKLAECFDPRKAIEQGVEHVFKEALG